MRPVRRFLFSFTLLFFLPLSVHSRPFVLLLNKDDLKDNPPSSDDSSSSGDSSDWDDFGDSHTMSEDDLDPGSWRPILDPASSNSSSSASAVPPSNLEILYLDGVRRMITAASAGNPGLMREAASEMEALAARGFPHAQSVVGFLHGLGCSRDQSAAKAFLYHHFAAEGGNMQSKMALAYTYFRQEVRELV